MTIQTTRWSPDTCKCEIEYTWDDTVPQDQRVHTMKSVRKCIVHDLVSEAKAYQNVLDENQSKNKAIGQLVFDYPQFKDKAGDIVWRIEQDRSVVITLPDEIKSDKVMINSKAIGKFAKQVSFE